MELREKLLYVGKETERSGEIIKREELNVLMYVYNPRIWGFETE